MKHTFRGDVLGKDQTVHLTDRIWLREQTGYVLRMRPESANFRRYIENYHGFSLTDVEVNKARHLIKPIVKNIIHFYVKIIAISMNKVGQNLNVKPPERNLEEEYESGNLDPYDYLDENGFENYCISMMHWNIETPDILKTIYEVMLNKPSCKPIKDILIYLYKRQPETPPPMSIELANLWTKFVEIVLECYDEIVLEFNPARPKAPQKRKATFAEKTSFQSLEMFEESFSNPVWLNILDSLEEIQQFTSRIKNETRDIGKLWPRILWYDKKSCRPSVPHPALMS